MEQFGLSCFFSLACSESSKGGKASHLYSLSGWQNRLLPLAVCRDPPAPQELILLCSVEQVWTGWNEEEMPVPGLPDGSELLCTLTFSPSGGFAYQFLTIHKLLLDQQWKATPLRDLGDVSSVVFAGLPLCSPVLVNPLLSCRYWHVQESLITINITTTCHFFLSLKDTIILLNQPQ